MIKRNNIGGLFLGLNSIVCILLALFNFFSPLNDFVSHLILLSISIMISGLICLTAFLTNKRASFRPGWLLPQAFILIVFGFYLLHNRLITDYDSYYIIFGSMGLFTGIIQFTSSLQIKALDIKKWYLIGLISLFNFSLGFIMMMNLFKAYDLLLAFISTYLFLLSISYIIEIYTYRKSGV